MFFFQHSSNLSAWDRRANAEIVVGAAELLASTPLALPIDCPAAL